MPRVAVGTNHDGRGGRHPLPFYSLSGDNMDRIKAFFAPPKASAEEYEPLADDDSGTLEGSIYEEGTPFSWIEYSIFALIGVAMLWAWYVSLGLSRPVIG